MMKRNLCIAICALFAFTALNAAVIVKQGNKTASYRSGSVVYVNGSADTTVDYDGMEIFIPKGTAVQLAPANNGMIAMTGKDLRGVRMLDITYNTVGKTTLAINPDARSISVREGVLYAVHPRTGQRETVNNGYKVTVRKFTDADLAADSALTKPEEESVFSVMEDFVSTDLFDLNSQQAAENLLEEEGTLSPSAPN